MNDITFEIVEEEDGFMFRIPAGDESAPWHGPFDSQADAQEAAVQVVEEFIVAGIKQSLGLS